MVWTSLIGVNRVKARVVFKLLFVCEMTSVEIKLFVLDHIAFATSDFSLIFHIWVESRSIWIWNFPIRPMSIWNDWSSFCHKFSVIFSSSSGEIVLRSENCCFLFKLDFGRLNIVPSKSFYNFLQFIASSSSLIIISFVSHSVVFLKEISSKIHFREIKSWNVFRN